MDRLRSLGDKLRPSATTSSKLSKAFKFDKEHKVLGSGISSSNDPFRDGPDLEEGFFCFLAMCTMAAVAAFQAKWFSVSGGTGFTLFLVIVTLLLTLLLVIIPLVYDRWDKCRSAARFLAVPRASLIIHGFGSLLILLAAFIVTISGCKDADNDPHESLGDTYKDGLKDWCNTKKASAIFDWLSFAAWGALLVMAALAFRNERRRDPNFTPPTDSGISYANVHQHLAGSSGEADPYADKEDAVAPAGSVTGYESYGYSRAGRGEDEEEAFGRSSMDVYGAFDSHQQPALQTEVDDGRSRTMQHAYTDPYGQIRSSLMSAQMGGGYPQEQQPQQSQVPPVSQVSQVSQVYPIQSPPQPQHYPPVYAGQEQQVYGQQPQQYIQTHLPAPPQYGGGYR